MRRFIHLSIPCFLCTMAVANPISVRPRKVTGADLLPWQTALVTAIALAIECGLLSIMIRKICGTSWGKILGTWFLVHLISFPTTLLLVKPLGLWAEIFPLVFEPWLFTQISKIPIRRSGLPVFASNIASFIAGLLLPIIWAHLFPGSIWRWHV